MIWIHGGCDDNQLKEYTGYSYITDPAEMVGASYDYIVITLDGIALRNSCHPRHPGGGKGPTALIFAFLRLCIGGGIARLR
jgi:hypothetical protein